MINMKGNFALKPSLVTIVNSKNFLKKMMIKAFLVSTKDLKFKLVCRQNLDFILRLTEV